MTPAAGSLTAVDDLLDRFEEAWQEAVPPQIEAFLPHGVSEAERCRALVELVRIDLHQRWERTAGRVQGSSERTCLEEYFHRFPELGAQREQALLLIAEEYRARHWWGDRPSHAEYLARFPSSAARLPEVLAATDAELAAEGAPAHTGTPPVAAPTSAQGFLEALRQCGVLGSARLAELVQQHVDAPFADPQAMARRLLERDWLTPWQANQLLAGRGPQLVAGPYILLGRLGEGGAGQVFKARHQTMAREVAIKVLRPQLVADPEVLGRFYREIRVVGQLSHPHIVHAYDAGPIGRAHMLVMEYVEGVDLARLVKSQGPLPVALACEYVRQAAVGLQYAHERGLVHRDVKPSNLLLAGGVVKVLDLGLARLQRTASDGSGTALHTAVGAGMMGTPDYLAPEQAMNFHEADARADVYSLGCTLFYLLTGQPPFPGGTFAQKLLRHETADPPALAEFRTNVPAEVEALLRRMLSKRPEDRCQTAGEVAATLGGDSAGTTVDLESPEPDRRQAAERHWRRGLLAGAAVLLVSLSVFGWLLTRSMHSDPGRPPAPSEEDRPVYPVLIVQCGKGHGAAEAELVRPGYGYTLIQGKTWDNWNSKAARTHCWFDWEELHFRVTVPPGSSGVLRLFLLDGDSDNRRQKVIVQGKQIGGEHARFNGRGEWVVVPLSAVELQEGAIDVRIPSLEPGTHNAVVSAVEFLAP